MDKFKMSIRGFMGETEPSAKISEIPLSQIEANSEQPRKNFDDLSLAELTASVKEYGILQPIILSREGERYIIIAGERRYRAATLAGLEKIPAIIKNLENKEAALIALVENVQREDLNYLEEARAYKKLMDDFNLTQSEIAEKVSKQQSTISNKIRLLSLPEDLQEQLINNRLTERHARALLKIKDDATRQKVINRVINNNLNVKQTEKLIEEVAKKTDEAERKRRKINYISYKIYINTLRKAYNQIKEMENNAKFIQEDKGDTLEIKIILPKNDRCFT
ncbi:MAG: ParB/RepB/Spo0J family partition protein [Firmicutes bacterium]|nr:ParB/RepB/Spo0J family partition protein [Bacillota bacterium]